MLYSLLAATLAGFVGSPHCIGMCGGFALGCARSGGRATWHLGRLTTYAALGALAGVTGAILPGPAWVPALVSTVLLVWFAGALAGLLPEPHLRLPGLVRIAGWAGRGKGPGAGYLLGVATGLLPCGLVYAALAVPVASGSALVGALSMVAFGAGTIPALVTLTLGAHRWATGSLRSRRLLAGAVLLFGLLSVGMRQGMGLHH